MSNLSNKEIPPLINAFRYSCIPIWTLIIMFGWLGNVLTIILLSTPSLRRHSTSFYLRCLAFVDILYLLFSLFINLLGYIIVFPDNLRDSSTIFCICLPFLHYSLSHLSVWLLVAVTVDRMIWVVLPFRAPLICSSKNAKITVICLILFICSLDSHFFFTVTHSNVSAAVDKRNSSNVRNKHKQQNNDSSSSNNNNKPAATETIMTCKSSPFIRDVFSYIDLMILLLIPFVFMIICNFAIVIKLHRMKKIRETRLQQNSQAKTRLISSEVANTTSTTAAAAAGTATGSPTIPGNTTGTATTTSNLAVRNRNTVSKKATSASSASSKSSSLTAMLLSINIFFFISITPMLIYDIVYFATDLKLILEDNETWMGIMFGVEQGVYTLWYLNFSAHFLLYCISGPRFRKEALRLLKGMVCWSNFNKPGTSKVTCVMGEASNINEAGANKETRFSLNKTH